MIRGILSEGGSTVFLLTVLVYVLTMAARDIQYAQYYYDSTYS